MSDPIFSDVDRYASMLRHDVSRALFAYWSRLRRDRPAPERWEIEPADISQILGDTAIVEVASDQSYPFRLAGTRLCVAFGAELRDRDFLEMWPDADREALETLLHCVHHDLIGGSVIARHSSRSGRSVRIEWLFLPLMLRSGTFNRLIASAAAIDPPYWLGVDPLVTSELEETHLIWVNRPWDETGRLARNAPATLSSLKPARRHGHLTILDGGRRD